MLPMIADIDRQLPAMTSLLQRWVNINTYTENLEGIANLIHEMQPTFQSLTTPDVTRVIALPSKRQGLFFKKRAHARLQIFFGGHLDTVYKQHTNAVFLDKQTLQGPGVIDMKGGLIVMLKALETFEKMDIAKEIGWEIFLNPDEEIGSPDSTSFIEECASRCHLACIFEPCLEDGSLVSARKGSGNYIVVSHGKKAHAGRDAAAGKNAIYPLVHFITQIEKLHRPEEGILLNVGVIHGGEAKNIIPDYAECHFNLRADTEDTMLQLDAAFRHIASTYELELVKTSYRPPKPFDIATEAIFQALKECATQLGIQIAWKKSGGVCDGNTFGAKGVPTLDTLGVRGAHMHTPQEYLHLESLCEKTKLTVLFLHALASGKINIRERI